MERKAEIESPAFGLSCLCSSSSKVADKAFLAVF